MSLQGFITDGYSCGQEGSPVVICVAVDLEKSLTEDTLLLNHCVTKKLHRAVHDVLHFMKYPTLQNQLKRLQNRASLLYQCI